MRAISVAVSKSQQLTAEATARLTAYHSPDDTPPCQEAKGAAIHDDGCVPGGEGGGQAQYVGRHRHAPAHGFTRLVSGRSRRWES